MYIYIFFAQRWLVWSCLVQHSGGPISDTISQLLLIQYPLWGDMGRRLFSSSYQYCGFTLFCVSYFIGIP